MTSMPANERFRASTLSNPQPQPPANVNKEDAADWLAIERALSRIDAVNPSHPYVLTIPQDVEPRYHHSNAAQARLWLSNTPFKDGEHEASQYLTWHFHEPGDMYILHSTRPREEREEASSRVGTPKPGGVKKTMSLGAYKKKVAGGTPGPEDVKKAEVNGEKKDAISNTEGEKSAKKPAVKGPIERVKADEDVLAAVEEGDDVLRTAVGEKGTEAKKDLKRKREDEKEESKDVKRKREDSKMSEGQEEKSTRAPEKLKDVASIQEKAEGSPRKSARPFVTEQANHPPRPQPDGEEPPTKKTKTSASDSTSVKPPAETKSAKQEPRKQDSPEKLPPSTPKPSTEDADLGLPPRLSPLREDNRESDQDASLLLPPRLSPTLPANITATLAARQHHRSTSKSSAAGDNLTPRKALENGIAKRKSPVNGFRANSSSPMVRSDAEDVRGRPKTSAPKLRSPNSSDGESENARDRVQALPKKQSKPKLVVKLKFEQRSTREAARQMLKLPAVKKRQDPNPSIAAPKSTDARHREQRDTTAKGVAQKVGPATKGVAKKVEKSATSTPTPSEKRPRDDESEAEGRAVKRKKADMAVYEPPAKRKKPAPEPMDLKKTSPATPSQPAQPPTPAPSVRKPNSQPTPNLNAPKKPGNELLAAATTSATLKREASHDSQIQIPTPSAASSSPAASAASQPKVSTVPKSTPTTVSTPAPPQAKTPRQKAWEAQRNVYNDLGRELKRAATADLTALEKNKTSTSASETEHLRRVVAVKVIESLLAFFLAFTSNDESLLAADPRLPLRTFHWRGLKDYFPLVKNNTEAYPALQGLACMLAVVFCTRIVELCAEERKGDMELLAQAWVLLKHSAADAEAKLDVRKLQEAFPRSWEGGVRDLVMGEEKLEPGKFPGEYKLPLGVQTTPVRAVRAAQAMLREWMEGMGVEYEMRLKLDQS